MKSFLSCLNRFLAPALCIQIAIPPLAAQSLPARIEVVVLEGEGVIHSNRQRAARNLVVRVEDDDRRPVAGASVVFAVPVSGASGEFPNGSTNLTVLTDNQGLATAYGFRTNQIPGRLQIYVTASYRGLRSQAFITQVIEGAPALTAREQERGKSGGKWKWIALGLVAAAGAGGGVYYRMRTQSSTPISVSTGPVVFRSPR
jgi:hypothetical protein